MTDTHWKTRPLSKFKSVDVKWLMKPFIPYGTITTVTGDGEVGKSTFLYDIAARITTGEAMPKIGEERKQHTDAGSVIILTKEDEPGLLRRRLEAAEADLDKIHFIESWKPSRDRFDERELLGRLDTTINDLTKLVIELGDVRMIIIDPITDFPGNLNLYREDQVRQLLGPIGNIARRFSIAVVNVLHLIKDAKKPIRQRILGSVGLVNISRSVLVVGKIGDRRFLMMEKANYAPEKKHAAFGVSSHEGQPVVDWERDYADIQIDEVLKGKSIYVTKQQQAGFELRKLLMDGPMQSTEIQLKAEQLGISWNTFKAAKKELEIESVRLDDMWWWQLPKGTSD